MLTTSPLRSVRGRLGPIGVGLLALSVTGCCELFGVDCPPVVTFNIINSASYAIQVKQQSVVDGVPTKYETVADVFGETGIITTSNVENPQDFSVTIFVGGGPVYTQEHLAVDPATEQVDVDAFSNGTFRVMIESKGPTGASPAAPCPSCPTVKGVVDDVQRRGKSLVGR